jgi:Txe/YoeB family toxin of toxin-antitoxin system
MVEWKLIYIKRAQEDALKIKKAGLKAKAQKLLQTISQDPYQIPPSFEKLVGLEDTYSRRINIRHRLIYQIDKENHLIIVKMLYKHYGQ